MTYFLPENKPINRPIIDLPILRSKPPFVVGTPVCLAKLCLAPVMPKALFHENENPYLLAIS